MSNSCPICDRSSLTIDTRRSGAPINCPYCGEYTITYEALINSRTISPSNRQRANASGWLSENQGSTVTTHTLDHQLFQLPSPSFEEKANKLLIAIEEKTQTIGEFINQGTSWVAHTWSINFDEIEEILDFLQQIKCIASSDTEEFCYKITPAGWKRLEDLKKTNIDKHQGFVAMWFHTDMNRIYDEAISKGILDAGYLPHRTDKREFNDKIDDEIIAQIKRSRFVLADFTGHRGGVYYEAGFAQGLGLEVIWTCRKDEVEALHFDVRQYNCIEWEGDKLEEFAQKITNRIEAIMGQGTYIKG